MEETPPVSSTKNASRRLCISISIIRYGIHVTALQGTYCSGHFQSTKIDHLSGHSTLAHGLLSSTASPDQRAAHPYLRTCGALMTMTRPTRNLRLAAAASTRGANQSHATAPTACVSVVTPDLHPWLSEDECRIYDPHFRLIRFFY